MRLENLQVDPHYSSGKVQITLDNTEPHYEILANQAYDFIDVAHIAGISTPQDVLYHGSLALRHPVSANSFNALLAGHSGRVFVDVNLRYPWWQVEHVKQLLNRADWAKLNEAELCCLSPVQHSLRQRMQLFRHTHNLNVLIVTRGEQGAIALNSQDEFFDVAPEQAVTVVDTVGAGDAFAAVLILGLQYDWPLALTLQRAQAFASAIVGQQGATVHDLCFYQTYSQAWQLD
jgi:fructokinase